MVLKYKALKANGLEDGKYWYVADEYTDENSKPCFTISLNRNRAKQFTEESAKRFNDKFLKIGTIDKPFVMSD